MEVDHMQFPPLHAGVGGPQDLGMAGDKEVEAQGQGEVPDA